MLDILALLLGDVDIEYLVEDGFLELLEGRLCVSFPPATKQHLDQMIG